MRHPAHELGPAGKKALNVISMGFQPRGSTKATINKLLRARLIKKIGDDCDRWNPRIKYPVYGLTLEAQRAMDEWWAEQGEKV